MFEGKASQKIAAFLVCKEEPLDTWVLKVEKW